MCDFKGLNLYAFFTSGDLLDAPEWDSRRKEGETKNTQHDAGHFDIALELHGMWWNDIFIDKFWRWWCLPNP